ncbi:MAG: hypothetical protein AAF557_18250 [Pseudomonadota bacterium]
MRKLALTGLVAVMALSPLLAQAGPRNSGDNAAQEQNLLLRAEWERAKQIGGYEDPITALVNLFNGTPTVRTIQPKLQVNGNETFEEYKRRIAQDLSRQQQ